MSRVDATEPRAAIEPGELEPFIDSTSLLGDTASLRARAARDGYLFFRGLLDKTRVVELRRAVLHVLDRHRLRPRGVEPLSGKLDLDTLCALRAEELRPDIGVTEQMYFELQQLPEVHRLPHSEVLLGVYRTLFGGDVFVHPRHIMRAMTPHPANGATPPHQDFPLIQGSTNTWTCWFPVGDTPISLGPLVVLRGSHANGFIATANNYGPVRAGDGTGYWTEWGAQLCENETSWVGGDFEAGDVLTFPCFTVHRSLPAAIRDEIRMSMDVRYQPRGDVIDPESLTNHSGRPWSEVYAAWGEAETDLKYYWENAGMSLSAWDESLMQPGARRIC